MEKFGTIHVALTSAGTNAVTPILSSKGSVDMKAFRGVINVNLYGSVHVAKYASMAMSKNKK